MVDLIAERPFMLTFILLAFAVASAYGWMQTGKRAGLVIAGVFLLLIPIGIYVEKIWVTDRESLVDSILQVAEALQANDHERVFQFIDPDAEPAIQSAKAELPRFHFDRAQVNMGGFRKFEIRSDRQPPEAIVDFTINVTVSMKDKSHTNAQVPRRLIVKFRKSGDIWRALEYTHLPVIGDPDGMSPNGGRPPTF